MYKIKDELIKAQDIQSFGLHRQTKDELIIEKINFEMTMAGEVK